MTAYIDSHKDRYGVEPICDRLPIAPSTYYQTRKRPPSRRTIRDVGLQVQIRRVYEANFSCYGPRKAWRQLHREGIPVARCTVSA